MFMVEWESNINIIETVRNIQPTTISMAFFIQGKHKSDELKKWQKY